MSDKHLTSIPNVSWPGAPCNYGVAINDGAGRWVCLAESTPCPAGTLLYVSPPEPFVWRFCASAEGMAVVEAALGPNQAYLPMATPAAPVPALSSLALAVAFVSLAVLGAWKSRG